MKYLYTIDKTDIYKKSVKVTECLCCGKTKIYSLADVIGTIQPQDVGKRIYETERGTIQVENQEQLKTRLEGG